MERQGLETRGWGLGIKGSRFGIGGSGLGALLGFAILIMGSAAAFAVASGSGGEREVGITVRVYDSAHLPQGTLIAAEKQAGFIFRQAGLAMRWCNLPTVSGESLMDSSCDQPAGAALKLRIVPRLKVMPGHTTASTMGFAVGDFATISYHWVKDADPSGVAMPWDILACVIAHEIGHLLLGPNSHSRTGIMVGKWRLKELQGARMGRVLFTPQQAEQMRAEVKERERQQPAEARSLTVYAHR